jgi:hypothetical protein
LAAPLLTVTLLGCACGSAPARPPSTRPTQIVPTTPDLIAAGQPQVDGDLWFLAGSSSAKTVQEINLVTQKVTRVVPVAADASAIAESSTGTVAVGFSDASGTLEFLNGATGVVVGTVNVAQPIRDISVEGTTANFFVLDGTATASTVNAVSADGAKVPAAIGVPLHSVALVVDPSATNLYLLQSGGTVLDLPIPNGSTPVASSSFFAGDGAVRLALSGDGSSLYVLKSIAKGCNVGVFNLSLQSQVRVLAAPAGCVDLVPSIDGTHLLVLVGTSTVGNIQVIPVG